MCLVNDDHVPFQLDPHGFPSWTVEEGIVGEHHQLNGWVWSVGVVSVCKEWKQLAEVVEQRFGRHVLLLALVELLVPFALPPPPPPPGLF